MSGKFKKQQKRRKWTEAGTVFPPAYLDEVNRTAADESLHSRFRQVAVELQALANLHTTYGEVEDIKRLLAALQKLQDQAGVDLQQFGAVMVLVVRLLFLDNSRPLHRQLLSHLRKLRPEQQVVTGEVVQQLVREHLRQAASERSAAAAAGEGKAQELKVPLAQAMVSLLWLGDLAHDWIRPCVADVVDCVGSGVLRVLAAAEGGLLVVPALMEELQDGISVLYYVLQRHGRHLAEEAGAAGQAAVVLAARVALVSLQGLVVVREAMASAAVLMWAAAVLPQVPVEAAAQQMVYGLMLDPDEAASLPAVEAQPGVVDAALRAGGSSLVAELRRFSQTGRVCAVKGLLSGMPFEALTARYSWVDGATGATREWSLLVDGALAAACREVGRAPDGHVKFHAMCAVAVALQKVQHCWQSAAQQGLVSPAALVAHHKGLTLADISSIDLDGSLPAPPTDLNTEPTTALDNLPEDPDLLAASPTAPPPARLPLALPAVGKEAVGWVMALLWAHLDEPLAQTVRRVQEAFETLLTILNTQAYYQGAAAQEVTAEQLVLETSGRLLELPRGRKGRYAPLAACVASLGARRLLEACPGLVAEVLAAMQDDMVANSASAFLKTLLAQLRDEAGRWPAASGDWKDCWMPPLLEALRSPSEKLRTYVSAHALPVVLGTDPQLLLHLLAALLAPGAPEALPGTSRTAALVAVLKAGRSLQLFGSLDHLEAACLNLPPASAAASSSGAPGAPAPSPRELLLAAVVHEADSIRVDALELACVNPRESELAGELELLMVRRWLPPNMRCSAGGVRNKCVVLLTRLLRRIRVAVQAALQAATLSSPGALGGAHPRGSRKGGQMWVLGSSAEAAEDTQVAIRRQQDFLQWLTTTLLDNLYPGAPYERKYFAMDVLHALLDTWCDADWIRPTLLPPPASGVPASPLAAFNFSPFSDRLLGSDTVRLLLGAVVDSWDKLRDGAAAALLQLPTPLPGLESVDSLNPLHQWAADLLLSPRVRESDAGARLLRLLHAKYCAGLAWRLRLHPQPEVLPPAAASVGEAVADGRAAGAEADSDAAAEAVVEFLESISDLAREQLEEGRRDLLAACRHSLAHGTLLALRYLVVDVEWQRLIASPACMRRVRRWFAGLLEVLMGLSALALDPLSRPQDQHVGAGEVDADDVGLEAADGDDAGGADEEVGGADDIAPDAQIIITGCWTCIKEVSLLLGTVTRHLPMPGEVEVLDVAQLQQVGALLLQQLFLMKHNGAVEKTQIGLLTVCERLLRCSAPALNRLPALWMQTCFERVLAPGQGLDDIVRRSSGLPFAFTALFLAEPPCAPKVLLPQGMARLLQIAADEAAPEPWPRVHAFNVLRMVFNDSTLASDTSGFYAQGVETAIRAMAAPHWEVRNGASLCFVALMTRMLGSRNASRESNCKRAVTGLEFFLRYPSLHAFLLQQLEEAVTQLESGQAGVHPSLFPVLVILSRLKPSLVLQDSSKQLHLSPAAFTPPVQRCAAARALPLRQLAARALAPLVAPEELQPTCLALIQQLLASGGKRRHNQQHGILLQLRALLELTAPGVAPAEAAALLASLDLPLAAALQPLASPRRCGCAVVRAAAVQVAAAALELAASLGDTRITPQLHAVAAECSEAGIAIAEQATAGAAQQPLPFHYSWLKQATLLWMGAALRPAASQATLRQPEAHSPPLPSATGATPAPSSGPTTIIAATTVTTTTTSSSSASINGSSVSVGAAAEEAATRLRRALQCSVVDVRAAGMKAVLRAVEAPGSWALREELQRRLLALLWGHLRSETDHKVLRRLLSVLAKLQEGSPGSPPAARAMLRGWEPSEQPTAATKNIQVISQLLLTASTPESRAETLCCYGHAVRQALASGSGEHGTGAGQGAGQVLGQFLETLEACCDPRQPEEVRGAGVRALAASGLLAVGLGSGGGGSSAEGAGCSEEGTRAWVCAVRLMEDEDVDVRQEAAAVCQRTLQPTQPVQAGSQPPPDKAGVPLSVEAVERLVFAELGRRWGRSPVWRRALADWIWGGEAAAVPEFLSQVQGSTQAAGGSGSKVVRRLFDREADNHHEEQLLLAQLAAGALRHAPQPAGGCAANTGVGGEELAEWCTAVVGGLDELMVAVEGLSVCGGVWVGGAVNHEEVYPRVMRALLALWACGGVMRGADRTLGEPAVDVLGRVQRLEHNEALVAAARRVQQRLQGEAELADAADSGVVGVGLLFLC